MNDRKIYQGFANNDQNIMAQFYNQSYGRFSSYFHSKYGKSDDYISDLFMESYEALWNNIHTKRLLSENLTSSMYQYLLGIAINMMKAGDRKSRELYKVNMFYKDAESQDEFIDKRVQKHVRFESEYAIDEKLYSDLQDFVDRAVNEMQPPCNEILRNFYWNRMSGKEIAQKMNYLNADSVKTQKNKCMKKLKPIVRQYRDL